VQSFRFERSSRLVAKADFDALYKNTSRNCRSSDALFTVLARVRGAGVARLGLSISSRVIPTAVGRNRVKRLARESFRHQQHLFSGLDVVVNARPAARLADNRSIVESLQQHWHTLKNKCAGS
jgi:ribonuclease P protein component